MVWLHSQVEISVIQYPLVSFLRLVQVFFFFFVTAHSKEEWNPTHLGYHPLTSLTYILLFCFTLEIKTKERSSVVKLCSTSWVHFNIVHPFQLHHFLRKIILEHNMGLDWKQKSDAEYDILNFWNFPKGLGLKVKVGTFSPNTSQHQQLSLYEHMIQWPEKFSEVSWFLTLSFNLL